MASIRRRKNGKWQVQIRRQGHAPVSKSLHTRQDAQKWARQTERELDLGTYTATPKPSDATLGDLVRRYRDEVSPQHRGGSSEAYVLNAFLRHPIASKKLSALTTRDFAKYRDRRLAEGIKLATLKRQLTIIRHMLNTARDEWGYAIPDPSASPLDKVLKKLSGNDQARTRRLKAGELEKLIKAARQCRSDNPQAVVSLIHLAVETAMRRGEMLAVRFEHIDTDRGELLVPQTKNGYPRIIPLTRRALAVLLSFRAHDREEVFDISANAFRLAWQRLKKRAGIDDLRFHDLRHEAISRLFERGLTVPEVQSISGHRTMAMLSRYSHANRALIKAKLR